MVYFVMIDDECENEDGEALFEIHNCFEVGSVRSWAGGRLITEHVPTPIRIDYEPYQGFEGPPVDLWDVCIPIMSKRLGDLLTEFGVDNLQLFPAILTNTATGEHYDYYAFNVVGLVSAADLAQSDHESSGHIGDTSFYSLAIDEQKTHDTLLFRLAENTAGILTHGSVRDYLVSHGFPDDMFVPPQDWAQL